MSLFDKEKDEILIKLVRDRPVIYDSSHPQHRNLIAKYIEWKEISTALDVPIVDIQKRWKHFRDHYKKKKKLKLKKNTWKYMPLLEFLSAPSLRLEEQHKASRLTPQEPQTSELSDISTLSDYENLEVPATRCDTPLLETGFNDLNNILQPIGPKFEDYQNLEGPSTSFHNFNQNQRKSETKSSSLIENLRKRLSSTDIRGSMFTDETSIEVGNLPNNEDENLMEHLDEKILESELSRHDSPIHRYFAEIAGIARMFPPHLVADLKLRIHKSIYQIELEWQNRKTEGYASEE